MSDLSEFRDMREGDRNFFNSPLMIHIVSTFLGLYSFLVCLTAPSYFLRKLRDFSPLSSMEPHSSAYFKPNWELLAVMLFSFPGSCR